MELVSADFEGKRATPRRACWGRAIFCTRSLSVNGVHGSLWILKIRSCSRTSTQPSDLCMLKACAAYKVSMSSMSEAQILPHQRAACATNVASRLVLGAAWR